MSGLEIVNYRVEHIWVEALIPYSNYRGAMADDQGKVWLPLDTSFKVTGYDDSGSFDMYSEVGNPLAGVRENYLAGSQSLMPLEYLQMEVNTFLAAVAPGTTYADTLHVRVLRSEILHILPSAPQFTDIAVTGEYTSLPNELIHTARFLATSPASAALSVFDISLPVHTLSNQKIAISFEPETVEDQEIINTWGGLDNTPGYLVRLRPVLQLNGERIVVGQEGFASGGSFDLSIELTSPAGTAVIDNTILAGYPSVQDAVLPAPANLQTEVTDLLFNESLNYIDHWNLAENELAELMNLRTVRPVSTAISLGGVVDVVELLGEPQGVIWKGLFLDADLRAVETSVRTMASDDRAKVFMQLSALQGSVLEDRIFEDAFEVTSISTAKLFGLAGDNAIDMLTIDAGNSETLIPTLPFDDNVKTDISAAVAEGLVVQIPGQSMNFQDWTGIGYLKEDLATGAVGYMLSGQIAGGMTAVTPDSWVYPFVYAFENPYAEEANADPLAAHSISKISGTDYQVGIAGEELADPLAVLVRDIDGHPVVGASVTFTILGGGGAFGATQTFTVTTDQQGIARAVPNLVLGQDIMAEAITYSEAGYEIASYARENTVTAELANGTRLVQPFVAIAN